jgi:hypothetical protein
MTPINENISLKILMTKLIPIDSYFSDDFINFEILSFYKFIKRMYYLKYSIFLF